MKVLVVYDSKPFGDNPFVDILSDYILKEGIDITCSVQMFWNEVLPQVDVIHFHWPEEVVGWNCQDKDIIDRLIHKIKAYKQTGSKVVYTRHNTDPHYQNKVIEEAYRIIEEESEVVVHMGEYSLHEFQQKYPDHKNRIIPHHIYEGRYDNEIDQAMARGRLDVSKASFVILCSGKFRKWEEVWMVLSAFFLFKDKNKLLIAPRLLPSFSPNSNHTNVLKKWVSRFGYLALVFLLKRFHVIAGGNGHIVGEDLFCQQLSAADVLFIQRKEILNSGNLPLAFLFRKPVIGPDIGNVGEILRATGNPVFDPTNIESIIQGLYYLKNGCSHLGQQNFEYAKRHWSISIVGHQYIELYQSLVRNHNT